MPFKGLIYYLNYIPWWHTTTSSFLLTPSLAAFAVLPHFAAFAALPISPKVDWHGLQLIRLPGLTRVGM
jgi:hypothetical protein